MPARVVSLVPSVTETLLDWGVDVVACTRFCEQPQLRHVGGTKDPDVAAIVALAPDVVVVDREENRRDDADELIAAGLRVHVTHVVHIDAVAVTLAELAHAVGLESPVSPVSSMTPESSEGSSQTLGPTRSAFVPIWRRPHMSINAHTYASSLLERIGVGNVLAGAADRYPTIELADVAVLAPDLVLLPSEPYRFTERHRAEYAVVMPTAAVVLVDGQDLFWWGARTAGAVGRLRDALRVVPTRS